jgi:hypothetical protein
MGKEIKTRAAARDIKVIDKAANVGAHMKNVFVKSKETAIAADRQAEQTQDTGHSSPGEYATDKVSGGAKDVTRETAHRLKNPQAKARENVNKAKEQFQKARQQMPKARKEAAEQAKQTAESAKNTAENLGGRAKDAQKTAHEAKQAVTDAKHTLQQTRQAGRQTVQTAKQTVRTGKQAEKTI